MLVVLSKHQFCYIDVTDESCNFVLEDYSIIQFFETVVVVKWGSNTFILVFPNELWTFALFLR